MANIWVDKNTTLSLHIDNKHCVWSIHGRFLTLIRLFYYHNNPHDLMNFSHEYKKENMNYLENILGPYVNQNT